MILSIGEPLVEFAALRPGPLGEAEEFRRGWGGDTSNFAIACARLGASVGYLTRVGDDPFGQALRAMWTQEGVDTRHVRVAPKEPTGIYFLAWDLDGRHTFTYYRAGSAAARLSVEDIQPEVFEGVQLVHITGITQAISKSARLAVRRAVELARSRGVAVSYDANIRPALCPVETLRAEVQWAIARADLAFLSSEDAAYLFGESSGEKVLDQLFTLGATIAVLKQGERGCLVGTRGGDRIRVPAWPVHAVDTTGAGDAFDAGFVVAWLEGAPLRQAAQFANAVGALTTTALGATRAIPTRAQVMRFLAVQDPSWREGG